MAQPSLLRGRLASFRLEPWNQGGALAVLAAGMPPSMIGDFGSDWLMHLHEPIANSFQN